jgi:hypothetical protein
VWSHRKPLKTDCQIDEIIRAGHDRPYNSLSTAHDKYAQFLIKVDGTAHDTKVVLKWLALETSVAAVHLWLVLCVFQAAEKSGEDLDAIPQVLETKIFVRGVLVVVVVRDGKGDDGDVVALLKKIHRETAARSR